MLKREDRERKAAEWVEHLQEWKRSGVSLSVCALQHGLAAWAAYQWRARLVRQDLWREEPGAARRSNIRTPESSPRVPLRFARVKLATEPAVTPMSVRVQLCNGRRVEIEIGTVEHLGEVLCALERVP